MNSAPSKSLRCARARSTPNVCSNPHAWPPETRCRLLLQTHGQCCQFAPSGDYSGSKLICSSDQEPLIENNQTFTNCTEPCIEVYQPTTYTVPEPEPQAKPQTQPIETTATFSFANIKFGSLTANTTSLQCDDDAQWMAGGGYKCNGQNHYQPSLSSVGLNDYQCANGIDRRTGVTAADACPGSCHPDGCILTYDDCCVVGAFKNAFASDLAAELGISAERVSVSQMLPSSHFAGLRVVRSAGHGPRRVTIAGLATSPVGAWSLTRANAYCSNKIILSSDSTIVECQALVLEDTRCETVMYGNGQLCRCVRARQQCDFSASSSGNSVYSYTLMAVEQPERVRPLTVNYTISNSCTNNSCAGCPGLEFITGQVNGTDKSGHTYAVDFDSSPWTINQTYDNGYSTNVVSLGTTSSRSACNGSIDIANSRAIFTGGDGNCQGNGSPQTAGFQTNNGRAAIINFEYAPEVSLVAVEGPQCVYTLTIGTPSCAPAAITTADINAAFSDGISFPTLSSSDPSVAAVIVVPSTFTASQAAIAAQPISPIAQTTPDEVIDVTLTLNLDIATISPGSVAETTFKVRQLSFTL
eukprot:SAG25_NODE_972_length_4478_cov_3.653574_2_plen_583_part_00